jgi:hypothetical protein
MIVLIVVLIIFIFWRLLGTKSQQAAQASPPTAPAPPKTLVAAGLATGPDVTKHDPSIIGAERDITPLDTDQGQINYFPPTNPNVFAVPKVATAVVVAVRPRKGNTQPGPGGLIPQPLRGPAGIPGPIAQIMHPVEFKVDGVVLGGGGFAMLTEGDQTYYRRVGDVYNGYRIVRISQDNIVVRKQVVTKVVHKKPVVQTVRKLWPVGDTVRMLLPGAAPSANPMPGRPMMRAPGART